MPEPSPTDLHPHHEDHPSLITRNARYGLILFAIYVVFYIGFMVLSAFDPQEMKSTPFGSVNLAISYGIGLIVVALVLALIYVFLCRDMSGKDNDQA